MTKKQKQKKQIEEVTNGLSTQCQISSEASNSSRTLSYTTSGKTVLSDLIDPKLLDKWPKVRMKVPPLFLHNPTDFEQHVKKIISMGIQFYHPHLGKTYTRVNCQSFNDHKHMIRYLDKKQLPYHTFGNPSTRKMKVVLRGLPSAIDLNIIKEELKSVSIPVIRVHKMHTEDRKDGTMLVLAVVPFDDDGKVILKVTKLLGHDVKLEPPKGKPKQCYRCQKWGHSQRYCHAQIKCVKCAEEHSTKKCEKPADKEPKCANCGGPHTASYRKCKFANGSQDYQMMLDLNMIVPCYKPNELVTLDNYKTLYKNLDYSKKTTRNI